ncbi:MAG: pilus assembly protein N-terminal domain-containing protein [Candidatus Eisenbacteria bacterium]
MRKPKFWTAFLVLLIAGAAARVGAETPAPGSIIEVLERHSRVLEFDFDVETISITDPDMADVLLVTPRQLLVHGKIVGSSSLIVWDMRERHYDYTLKIISAKTKEQIQLRVRVVEANRDALNELGIDWLIKDFSDRVVEGDKTIAGYAGSVQTPADPLRLGEGVSGLIQYIGKEEEISSIVHAVDQDGGLRLLAKPDLICLNGETASFLVGGEIPIPVSQSATGGSISLTIEWKEFGVRLRFTPTVVGENLVRLDVQPEVSSLDYANAITFGGFNIPAIRTRKASTTVELHSDETFVIGGLLTATETDLVTKIPLLGSIPLLGVFFSNTTSSSTETELMILISPKIVEPLEAGQIPELPWATGEE